MDLHYFDGENRQDTEGPVRHGPLGFNHCGTTRGIDYTYQAEMWLEEILVSHPEVVRAELHAGGRILRRWVLEDGRWMVVPWDGEDKWDPARS